MSDPKSYYARWKHNRGLARVCRTRFIDGQEWAIVLSFYAAVHIIEGYMRTKDERFWSEDHVRRVKSLRQSPEARQVAALYRDLTDLSESVRYQPGFQPKDQDFDHARDWLHRIESMLKGPFSRAVGEDPNDVQ